MHLYHKKLLVKAVSKADTSDIFGSSAAFLQRLHIHVALKWIYASVFFQKIVEITSKTNDGSQTLMSSPKVDSHCVYNSIFTVLRGSINSRKGKILSNVTVGQWSPCSVCRSIWGGVVQARFKDNCSLFLFLFGFI